MLVAFHVGNFRSIRETQTLSLVRSPGSEKEASHTIASEYQDGTSAPALLKSVAIYGPNAAGKSTIISAMSIMRSIVVKSASMPADSELPVEPFALDTDSAQKPSLFEMVFVMDRVRYQYGFEVSAERIVNEWLYAFPKGRPQEWFTREWHDIAQQYVYKFGDKLKGQRGVWEHATRKNALLLSTAVQLNSEQLKPIYDWFKLKLKVNQGFLHHDYTAKRCNQHNRAEVLEFMRAADFAIDDFEIEANDYSLESFPEMPDPLKSFIFEQVKNDKEYKVSAKHKTEYGTFSLPMELESDGTKKIFNIAGHWLDALKEGRILVIDELHERLHPHLVKFLIETFHSPEHNTSNAQLILTTHDTSILSQNVFRRDQIWFAERDSNLASKFYPLTDFSPKKGQDNLEKGYLGGRYGAVPSIRKMITMFYGA